MKTKTLKATSIIALILEIICALAMVGYIAAFVMTFISPEMINDFIKTLALSNRGEMSVRGFDIIVLSGTEILPSAVKVFVMAGALTFACHAMVFRNIHLILKVDTPFKKDVVQMVRQIGFYYILSSILQLVLTIIYKILNENGESSWQFEGIITGLVIIALSQIFGYGKKLEDEVEGLV